MTVELKEKPNRDPELLATQDPVFLRFKDACQNLLQTTAPTSRKYYYVNILKLVKTYEAYESFGELALITNKRRKAKLECSADTHFAVLSREHYREA